MLSGLIRQQFGVLTGGNPRNAVSLKARSQLGGDSEDEEQSDGHQLKNPTGSKQ